MRVELGPIGARIEADDICQETFYRALRWYLSHIGTQVAKRNPKAFLKRISTNLIIDGRRKPTEVPLDDERLVALGFTTNPETTLLQEELRQCFLKCIEKLTAIRREVFELVDILGVSEPEASDKLNTQIATLRKRLFDARRQLWKCMQPYLEL